MAIVAASRLIFAVARDGVLPMSSWIGQVDAHKQPKNAVTVMYIFGATLLCTILPSQVAFTSLISAGGIPTTAADGLIALLRLFMTPNDFKSTKFGLGRFAKPFYIAAAFFNAIVFAVSFPFSLSHYYMLTYYTLAGTSIPIHVSGDCTDLQFCVFSLNIYSLIAVTYTHVV